MSTAAFLFFDVETNDMPNWRMPADHPSQARIVQVGAVLTDVNFTELAVLDCLVKPDGWRMAPGAQGAHGISIERCRAEGLPIADVVDAFDGMADTLQDADGTLCAFNIRFDNKLVRGERRRIGRADRFGVVREFDAMRGATPVCKMPPTPAMMRSGRFGPKTPKLGEAHEILLGSKMVGAHDALSDVRATIGIVRCLRDQHGIDILGERPLSFQGAVSA